MSRVRPVLSHTNQAYSYLNPSSPSVSRRNRTSIQTAILTSLLQRNASLLIHELLRHLLTQIDSQETLRQLDSVELGPQSLQNLLPLAVAGQTASRSTSNAVLAVQLHVERVKGVASWRERDADGVVVCYLASRGINVVLGLVQLEADLRQVVELWDGVAGDLSLYAAFEDAVE